MPLIKTIENNRFALDNLLDIVNENKEGKIESLLIITDQRIIFLLQNKLQWEISMSYIKNASIDANSVKIEYSCNGVTECKIATFGNQIHAHEAIEKLKNLTIQ